MNTSLTEVSPLIGDEVFLRCEDTFRRCAHARGVEDIFADMYTIGMKDHLTTVPLGNTTEVARLLQAWNLKDLVTSPSMLLSAYKEVISLCSQVGYLLLLQVRQYYDAGAYDASVDRGVKDSVQSSGAATLVGGLLMDLLAASGHASLVISRSFVCILVHHHHQAGIQFSVSVVTGIIGTLVESLFHFFFAVTALYYLLQSEQGGLHDYMATVRDDGLWIIED